jgi:hypothetical protein
MFFFVLAGLVGTTLFVLLAVSICYWIYSDASSRGSNFPLLWAIGSTLSGILGIYYLFIYRRSTDRSPSSPRERLAQTIVFANTVGRNYVSSIRLVSRRLPQAKRAGWSSKIFDFWDPTNAAFVRTRQDES